ncbi:protein kinase domain-containing protein [Actinoplanes sp. HUAS TT8]|uniref:serine/threonine-protein kinase n=1 Tax=Actinoplanes sp. HUAS TT8 TaxID=3447453 RepID=UPI003F51D8FD
MAGQEALGREYLLHEEIGRGALAVVRRATRRSGGPPLAAKLMRPELAGDRRVRQLFLREEAALRAVDHPGIVGFRDLVVEGGTLALLMDFVDGPDLRRHLADRGGRLTPAETATIAAQVADALDAAHARGVVHLDLKPENLLLVRGTNPPQIRVTDFGVAVLLMDADRGVAGGTPGYTAPEIWHGTPPTPAADVYSLGILLVELVTGDPQGAPESLPEELAGPARSCLSTDPGRRPTAHRVATYLRSLVASGVLGTITPLPEPATPEQSPSPRLTTVRSTPTGPWAGAFTPAPAAEAPAPAAEAPAPAAGTPAPAAETAAPAQPLTPVPSSPDHLGHWAGQLAGTRPATGNPGPVSPADGRLAGAAQAAGRPDDSGRPAAMPRPDGAGRLAGMPRAAGWPDEDGGGGQLAGTPVTGWLAGATPTSGGPTEVHPPAEGPEAVPAPAGRSRRWRRGPLVTLGVAVAVAAALVGVNMAAAADRRADDRQAPVAVVTSAPQATAGQGAAAPAASLPPTEPVRAGTSAPAPVRITLAGHVEDDAGTLAISIRDQQAIAYICDGNRLEAWLKGTAENGRLNLFGKNGAKVVGTFDKDSARGQVTVVGATHDFVLGTVKKPSGLYRTSLKVRNAKVQGAWIVLPDGRQVGVLTLGDQIGPAPQLDVATDTTTVDGTAVPVTAVDAETGTGF